MPGGDVEELLRGLWLVTAELMHDGSTVHAGQESWDDISITNFGELMTLSGETSDVVPQGFALFLLVTIQMPWVTRLHVHALKVVSEDLLDILPIIDRVSG
jgi:hypothetical protein